MLDRLVGVILDFLYLFRFWHVVDCYERVVILRNGEFKREKGTGIAWHWPFIERALAEHTIPATMLVGPLSATSRDGEAVIASALVTYRVEDVRRFLLEVEAGHHVINDACAGTLSRYIMRRTFDQARGVPVAPVDAAEQDDAEDADNELSKAARRKAKRYGVHIMRVQLVDFTRSRSYRLMQFNHKNIHE